MLAVVPALFLFVFPLQDREHEVLDGIWDELDLRRFIDSHALPLVTEMSPNNFEELTSQGKHVVFAVTDPRSPETDPYVDMIRNVAREWKHTFLFATMDGVKYDKSVCLPSSGFVAFVVSSSSFFFFFHSSSLRFC
jgi:hypothetical protein